MNDAAIIARPPFPNALLVGSLDDVGAIMTDVLPRLRRPITHCDHCVVRAIRGLAEGTLVIWSVEHLVPPEQQQLLAFIEDRRRAIQVISVAEVDLFREARMGAFLERLYYRLNTVCLQLTTTHDRKHAWPDRRASLRMRT